MTRKTGGKWVAVVLGMHRSGTSAITRALVAAGVELGDHLVKAGTDNPRGFWEDADVRRLNERLMATVGTDWYSTRELDPDLFSDDATQPLLREAVDLLNQRLSNGSPWGFKDPRTTRLLPFWKTVFSLAGIRPRWILALRDPEAVAQSLLARNNFSMERNHLLWIRYMEGVINELDDESLLVVDYSRLLEKPGSVVEEMRRFLGLDQDAAYHRRLKEFSDDFLDVGLRHHQGQSQALRESQGPQGLTARLYLELLDQACRGEWVLINGFSESVKSLLSQGLRNHQALLTQLETQEAAISIRMHAEVEARLKADMESSHKEIERLQNLAQQYQEEYEAEIKHLQTLVTARDREIIRYEKEVVPEVSRLQRLVEQTNTTIIEQQQDLEAAGLEANRLKILAADKDRKLMKYEEEVSQLRDLVKEISDTAQQQQEQATLEIDRLEKCLAENEAHRTELQEQLAREQARHEASKICLQQDIMTLRERLEKERYTFFKPIARRIYRRLAPLALNAPGPLRRQLRTLKRRIYPHPVLISSAGLSAPLPSSSPLASTEYAPLVHAARLHKGDNADVILFPVIDWHFRIQRPQHLCRGMAANGHRVFYLATTFIFSHEPGFTLTENPESGLFLCQLHCNRPDLRIYERPADPDISHFLVESLRLLASACEIDRTIALVDLPFWRPIVLALRNTLVVYDCMDHHAGFSTNADSMLEEETKLLHQSDLVITTAQPLSEKIAEQRENTLIRNAAEIEMFARPPKQLAYEKGEKPVIGYYGAISEWFDIDLLASLAKARPQWSFVLVGSTFGCDIHQASWLPNVEFVGEVPYTDLPGWLYAFDVCLIPFRVTELTRCTNPVKAYEYLAAGKPVVGTKLPELLEMDGMVRVAEDSQGFLQELEFALGEKDDEELTQKRKRWAEQHDWHHRAGQLDQAIGNCLPSASVIVLTYNNLEFTKACLHSLEHQTHYPNWELIIVDNGSDDDTVEYLEQYARENPRVTLVLNGNNHGFAAGNNHGMQVAKGEYLILLNNDTYTTCGWLYGLLRHLIRDPSIGLVGPVTNNIGNEARIDIEYADMQQMELLSYDYTQAHARELLEVDTVAFFCVAMHRSLYEEIGGLDERFGRGFFEDDDYCMRTRQAGKKVVIAEDVFIHHHLSASFGKLENPERVTLFEKNKHLYEEKWGKWNPHSYR
ncbi:glycosyltransferase [Thiolapillus brandeum]|uniref:Glycosyl transferase family 2 n=1 Tax=Thiolapillus brandeum TaxID=1076588 RepID=A0A7U6GIL0_9GAMM|nr:glycosyltransferase [Thiolapillus brandeum]BAO44265.1 glycosyl transferase family 2 [Thiolapillus brandeum]